MLLFWSVFVFHKMKTTTDAIDKIKTIKTTLRQYKISNGIIFFTACKKVLNKSSSLFIYVHINSAK